MLVSLLVLHTCHHFPLYFLFDGFLRFLLENFCHNLAILYTHAGCKVDRIYRTSVILRDTIWVAFVSRRSNGQGMIITVQLTNILEIYDDASVKVLNMLYRKCLKYMRLRPIESNFYDLDAKVYYFHLYWYFIYYFSDAV